MNKKIFGIMTIILFLVIVFTLTVPAVSAENATVVTEPSNGDCSNVTFEVGDEDYESYCVEYNETTPEIGTVYEVESNLTSNNKITKEQAQKIKIFAINYNGTDLSHYINDGRELDDVTSRQLIIWYILDQGKGHQNWPISNHVNESIILHINQLYDDGLRYDDKGSFPINNTTNFKYSFKYFTGREDSLQDYLGWLFTLEDIPPQDNKTNNSTNKTPPKNETPKEPPKNETPKIPPKNETPKETPKEITKEIPKKRMQMTNAAGNPLGILVIAGLGLGATTIRNRRRRE